MTSKAFVLKSIQDEYAENTGSRPSASAADAILDQRLAAFQEKLAGAGAIYAVRDDRLLTDWLKNLWVGENNGTQGAQLRQGCIVVDAQREVQEIWPVLDAEAKAKLAEQVTALTGEGSDDVDVAVQAKQWKKLLVAVREAAKPAEAEPVQEPEPASEQVTEAPVTEPEQAPVDQPAEPAQEPEQPPTLAEVEAAYEREAEQEPVEQVAPEQAPVVEQAPEVPAETPKPKRGKGGRFLSRKERAEQSA